MENLMTKLYFDGDLVLYRAAAAVESRIEWDDEVTTTHFDLNEGLKAVSQILNGFLRRVKESSGIENPHIIFCLSCRTDLGYRRQLFPEYKSGRGQKPLGLGALRKPENLESLGNLLEGVSSFKVSQRDTLEADDIMGIAMSLGHTAVTDDKDLGTCPGYGIKLTQKDGVHELSDTTREQADHFLMIQWMTGDSTDGIPGLPGIGPVKAEKLIAAWEEDGLTRADMVGKIYELYEQKAPGKALTYFHSVYILRSFDEIGSLPKPENIWRTDESI